MDDDEHEEFGDWFDPEEEHERDSRRPSPKILALMAVTGLVIVVIAVAAGISAITDKSTDDDQVAGVRVGASAAITVPTTTSSTTPTTTTSTSAAPEPGTFEAEFVARSQTVPRLGELSVLEARGHARTMCLRMDSHVSEADILKEAEETNELNPDVAAALLELAKETVCPEQDDTPDDETTTP